MVPWDRPLRLIHAILSGRSCLYTRCWLNGEARNPNKRRWLCSSNLQWTGTNQIWLHSWDRPSIDVESERSSFRLERCLLLKPNKSTCFASSSFTDQKSNSSRTWTCLKRTRWVYPQSYRELCCVQDMRMVSSLEILLQLPVHLHHINVFLVRPRYIK